MSERFTSDGEAAAAAWAHLTGQESRPTVRATRYEVSLLPEGDINYRHFAVTVEYRGNGRWAVHDQFACLSADGTWDEGIKPYGRGDAWLEAHRFDLDTALKLAREAAPHVRVNRWTAAEALRDRQNREVPNG